MAHRLVFIFLVTFQLSHGVVRKTDIDELLRKQRESIVRGASNKLKGNNIDEILLSKVFFDHHGAGVTERQIPKDRKEYRCLLPLERQNLHAALKTLKTTKPVGAALTQYDNFIAQHDRLSSPAAHASPSFLPWHRHYLYSFELLLQNVCPTCTLPFWDSRLDGRLGGNPRHSVLFSSILAGNAVGQVVTGFAANWTSPGPVCASIHPTLKRNFNTNVFSLYDDDDVKFAENILSHRALSYPWDDAFEMSHGYVHTAFGSGSHMTSILCSPCDPMFIFHHTFIDNLFERARNNIKLNGGGLKYTDVKDLPFGFVDVGDIVRVYSAPNATMLPFIDTINSYGLLSDNYTNSWYRYERSPGDVSCKNDADCCANGNVGFLWCNTNKGKCFSKVNEGGITSTEFPERACYCPPGRKPFIKSNTCSCK